MSSMRRLFDLARAAGGVVFFAPIMAIIAVAVLVGDGRPLLFRQERVGYRRRPFTILKFRTMRDERVTRVGRLLRATGLDEIAQFINILRGDMSAVGPRPLTQDDIRRLGWNRPEFDFRWNMRPGLTGLAQIVGAESAADALALDRLYEERQSLRLDCELIALSFAVNAVGKARLQRWLRATQAFPSCARPSLDRSG